MNCRELVLSGFEIYWEEEPVRDARIMDDKAVDVLSTTSSELSDSLRDQILGKPYNRARKSKNPIISPKSRSHHDQILNTTVPSKSQDLKLSTISPHKISEILAIKTNSVGNNTSKPHLSSTNSLRKSQETFTPSVGGLEKSPEIQDKSSKKTESKLTSVQESVDSQKPSSNLNKTFRITDSNSSNTKLVYYVAAETQTSDKGSSESLRPGGAIMEHKCKCCVWQAACNVNDCECGYSYDDTATLIDESTSEQFDTFSETTQTSTICCDNDKRRGCCRCCCNRWDSLDDEPECGCNYIDLPYQNNEEYMKLVQELQDKLVARNKERVRRTMREFELRSRLNMNLDKPIFDEDHPETTILNKLNVGGDGVSGRCPCCQPKTRTNSDIFQNERMWECHRLNKNPMKGSRWQLDPRSGEWVKIASYVEADDDHFPRRSGIMVPKIPKLRPPSDGPSSCCRKEHCRRHGRF